MVGICSCDVFRACCLVLCVCFVSVGSVVWLILGWFDSVEVFCGCDCTVRGLVWRFWLVV